MTKKAIRDLIKSRLRLISPEQRTEKSRRITDKILAHPAFRTARTVFCFASIPEEVSTEFLLEAVWASGKRLALPKTDSTLREISFYEVKSRSELKPGVFGILEPDPATASFLDGSEADCVIVPGVAFDRAGNRLGHGAGYYDKFLKKIKPGVLKIAPAFSEQIVEKVPTESHDIPLDEVITE